jgi:UV DNA damage endonuclease
MIEAKDKEQAVFELMRTFKLPGWDTFNGIIPYERSDDNKPLTKKPKKTKTKTQIENEIEEFGKELSEEEEVAKEQIPKEEAGMGGKENRVYWPVGMEEWLRPKKREVKKRSGEDEEEMFRNPTPANFAARKAITARNREPLNEEAREELKEAANVADIQRLLDKTKAQRAEALEEEPEKPTKKAKCAPKKAAPKKKTAQSVPTPSFSNMDDEDDDNDLSMPDLSAEDEDEVGKKIRKAALAAAPARQTSRARGKRKSYAEIDGDLEEE